MTRLRASFIFWVRISFFFCSFFLSISLLLVLVKMIYPCRSDALPHTEELPLPRTDSLRWKIAQEFFEIMHKLRDTQASYRSQGKFSPGTWEDPEGSTIFFFFFFWHEDDIPKEQEANVCNNSQKWGNNFELSFLFTRLFMQVY